MPLKQPLKILHIDDSSIFRKTISRGLEAYQEHYELTQVGSVSEALSLLATENKFDLILTDWLMSGKSGLDLLCELKRNPIYHRLPVVFLTSEYDSASLISAVTYGAAGILRKPITGPEIHTYLQKKEQVIEDSFAPEDLHFVTDVNNILNEIHQLPLLNKKDLSVCLQHVQHIKVKATSAKWPLLADYSQKVDEIIQETIKKEVDLLTPLVILIHEYYFFLKQSLLEIQEGRPHPLVSEQSEKNLKIYLTNLEAGWFANDGSVNGAVIPWDVVADLQKHLSPDGLKILEPYITGKSKVG